MRILVTGGSGLLGSEILKLDSELVAPGLEQFDITNLEQVRAFLRQEKPDAVLHLAAATNPPQHEENPRLGLEVNILGTTYVAMACQELGIRLVYPCTDHLYVGEGPHKETEPVLPPSNFYISKLGGECAVRLVPNSLVLRLTFGPRPFPYDKVYADHWNSKLYVDEMAPLVLAAVKSSATGIMNLGGPRTSLEDYARRTRPDIQTIPRPEWVPMDTSFDLTRMQNELGISDLHSLLKA